jgi:hypothetical protein
MRDAGTARSERDRENRGTLKLGMIPGETNTRRARRLPVRRLRMRSGAIEHVPQACQTRRSPMRRTLRQRQPPGLPVLRNHREQPPRPRYPALAEEYASSGETPCPLSPTRQQYGVRYVRKRP